MTENTSTPSSLDEATRDHPPISPTVDNATAKKTQVTSGYVDHSYTDYSRGASHIHSPPTAEGIQRDGASFETKTKVKKRGNNGTVPFPGKLLEVLDRGHLTSVIDWMPHGRAFIVKQPKAFTELVLPSFSRQTKFLSFTRQLNLWGFKRLTRGLDIGAYYHEMFLPGRIDLVYGMTRQKIKGTGFRPIPNPEREPNFYRDYPPVRRVRMMPSVATTVSCDMAGEEVAASLGGTLSSYPSPMLEQAVESCFGSRADRWNAIHSAAFDLSALQGKAVNLPASSNNNQDAMSEAVEFRRRGLTSAARGPPNDAIYPAPRAPGINLASDAYLRQRSYLRPAAPQSYYPMNDILMDEISSANKRVMVNHQLLNQTLTVPDAMFRQPSTYRNLQERSCMGRTSMGPPPDPRAQSFEAQPRPGQALHLNALVESAAASARISSLLGSYRSNHPPSTILPPHAASLGPSEYSAEDVTTAATDRALLESRQYEKFSQSRRQRATAWALKEALQLNGRTRER